MPFTVSSAENMVVKFFKNLTNELVYNPQQVLYDTAYGTVLFYALDQTPVPNMIGDVVNSIPVSQDVQNRITAGALYGIVKTANTAWDNSMS